MIERSVTAGWISDLSCGHVSPWVSPDGHVYGQLKPGDWISCSTPPCQTSRKVLRVIPVVPMIGTAGMVWADFREHFNGHAGQEAHQLHHRELGPGMQTAYRLYHDRLHAESRTLDHEHSPV